VQGGTWNGFPILAKMRQESKYYIRFSLSVDDILTMSNEHSILDISKVIKRLELIKGLISLQEDEEIFIHIDRLKSPNNPSQIGDIIDLLDAKRWVEAVEQIEDFVRGILLCLKSMRKPKSFFLDPLFLRCLLI
jgi:hypothetical protein